ncbi:MAG: UDP-3-O-(3-hydroxymyristoyl)glucosamine N-acyltransferase [Phycisphaeraceae bacterium]
MTDAPATTSRALAELVGGELRGEAALVLTGVAELRAATTGDLTFVGDRRYAALWSDSRASAALIQTGVELEPGPGRALIRVDDADLAMAKALAHFAPPLPQPGPGVHRSAVVDPTAVLGQDVQIGPLCVVGPRARLADGCVLHAHVTVMDDVSVGTATELWPGVVVRERCTLGARCILHANSVVGADGFGYRPAADGSGLVKIPQIGTVEIGDDVEIGAGTCIDRAKYQTTTIGRGTKIDNLVQVGHNVRIGAHVIIAGASGIGGSVTIGDGAMLGGMVAVRDHVTIGPGARLAGTAQVMRDVPAGETWAGSPARPYRQALRQVQTLHRLPDLVKQLKRG